MTDLNDHAVMKFGGVSFAFSRPEPFGLVIEGPVEGQTEVPEDYLNEFLLAPHPS